ncbi:MAG: tetratricopeptide repeat protein [FCB group bacterium]|nr:tetratricopeptide repeat protein [FCB group bacterium]
MNENKANKPNIRNELLRQLKRAIQMGDAAGGLRLAATAREEFTDRTDPRTGLFRCYEARLFYLSSDYQKTLTSSRLAASLLAPFGETVDLAKAYLLSGKALVSLGNYREAETAFLDAESLFRRCENSAGRIDTVNQLARVYYLRAEYKNTIRQLLKAVKLANAAGDRKTLAYLWGNLGRVYTRLGNFKKAAESLRLNLEISEDLGDDRETAKALLSLGYIEMRSGRYEMAETHYTNAHPLLIKERMRHDLVIHRTYVGELLTCCGEYTAARRSLNEAIDMARALAADSPLLAAPLRVLAELEMACGKNNAASRLANKVLAMTDKISEPLEKGAALQVLARIAAADKRNGYKKAVSFFARALEIFDEIDTRFEKAEVFVRMAQSGLGSPRRILANLFRAADIYQRLGITGKYEKTQEMINGFDSPEGQLHQKKSSRPSDEPVIVTANRRMKKIMRDLKQAAATDMPILLIGETGTGKDILARHYHAHTERRGRFVAVNCAAFPETLLEAELFGYLKGAFTGAAQDKEGLMQRAAGGTFFFDEIGEMSLASQAKLLTVIETCRARRLGGTVEEKLDIRIVAATNCDLEGMVEEGTFRRDLFYRLSGISFTLPPLAERPEDIPLLLSYFLKKEGVGVGEDGGSVDSALIGEFTSRSWPGNVRQLESEVKKLVLFSTMAREDSLGELAGVLVQNDGDGQTASLVNQVEQFEKALIIKALRRAEGNKSQAARTLAIHESTLRAKMKRYDLHQVAVS